MTRFDQTIQEIESKYPGRKIDEPVAQTTKGSGVVAGLNYFAYLTFVLSAPIIIIGFVNGIPIYVAAGVASIPAGLLLMAASAIIVHLADISAKLNK